MCDFILYVKTELFTGNFSLSFIKSYLLHYLLYIFCNVPIRFYLLQHLIIFLESYQMNSGNGGGRSALCLGHVVPGIGVYPFDDVK